jgi:exodeoxyribonuclease VII large subunit
MTQTHILTVTQLTSRIKTLLEGTFPDVWVEGEISNLTVPQSGHAYFTLKDPQSQVRAVLFKSSHRHLKFTLQHGMQVVCRGRLSLYEPRGEYQVIVDYVEPKGVGALQKAFEELKARLEKEGLFELERKKPLPLLPGRIGIVTSPTGAAIRDILKVIKRRHPRLEILIYPVPVQGAEAAPSIVEAIGWFNAEKNVDVLIVGRGGGSLEDLWAFNEEPVARAIFASRIPVISAVGHETDFTIADFTADLRAPTPSAAAEMVVESDAHLRETVLTFESRLAAAMRQDLDGLRTRIQHAQRLLADPRKRLLQSSQRVDELLGRLGLGLRHHVRRYRALLTSLSGGLEHLNPLAILARGYSVTRSLSDGRIIRDAADSRPGDLISTKLHRGELVSRVEKKLLP